MYSLTRRYPCPIDDLLTVVWWEQRGPGLSFEPGISREEMTAERFVADALAVTDYLRGRYGAERISLMALPGQLHRTTGGRAVPELYRAYVGSRRSRVQIGSEVVVQMPGLPVDCGWP